jgi:tRNA(fMet)-specific endonuclease VapC
MILLDTDHLSVVSNERHSGHLTLVTRLQDSTDQDIGTAIVSVEEQCKGWLAKVNQSPDIYQQIFPYGRLRRLIRFLNDWEIIMLDAAAADRFSLLRKQRVRIGTQDLKIAAIALAHDALLLSANLRDFRRVPSLRVENWLI